MFDRNRILFAGPSVSRTASDVQERAADEPSVESVRTRKRSAAFAGGSDRCVRIGTLLSCGLFLMAFLLFRHPSSSKRQAVGSIVSPVDSTPAAPAESGGSGSARGQCTSGHTVVLRFTRVRKFVLKQSP